MNHTTNGTSTRETRRTDVLVVGSGISGSSAALQAARAGCRVTLLEKSCELGGSAALSAGMFWTAPSLEAYRTRIPLGRVDLGERLVADYEDAVAELRDMGVRVADEPQRDIMTFGIGFSTDIRAVLAYCWDGVREAGGHVHACSPVVDVLIEDGRVTGATVRQTDGTLVDYWSAAVVLATGGFQGDPEMLTRYIGPNADRLLFRSNLGSVGDGLRLARAAGTGGSTAMGTFYGHLLPWPVERFTPEECLPYSQYYSGHTLLVNLRGDRFADETLGDEIVNQELTFQPEARGVLIFDDHVRHTEAATEPFPGLGVVDRFATAIEAGGQHASAGTIPELLDPTAAWGLDRHQLERTVEAYTAAVGSGPSTALGIPVSGAARAPQTAPFHALMVQPSITFTFGGVPTSPRGEALQADGRPVPGLYTAGADVGGLSNHGYAGGLAPGYITGRWAGRTAAEWVAALAAPSHT